MEVTFELIRNFGPSVSKFIMPSELVENLNNYIDQIISDQEKSKSLDKGESLVGDVTQEFELEQKMMVESGWTIFLADCAKKWIEIETEKKITKFEMLGSWIVRQFKNEYNPTHWHSGHISGAGFLKVPSSLGIHVQKKETQDYRGGNLQLIHGSKMFLCQSTLNIVPKVGDFYFFPHYLMHIVFPFKGSSEERRSISFNANIDDNIYNVYGS